MAHPFSELQPEYQHDLQIVQITKETEVDQIARRIINKPGAIKEYEAIRAALGIPIVVQAAICEREDGTNFSRSPAQGDPWNQVSTHVPRGIGPFNSWFDAAVYSW